MGGSRLHAILISLVIIGSTSHASAHSLKNLFDQVLQFEGQLDRSPRFRRGLESVIASFQLNAVRTADFVATATTPGFAYRYDPETGVFKRTETARGPVYVEPADTVGRNQFDVSFAYQYANFTELDGESLEDAFDSELTAVRGTDKLDIRTRKFSFYSQVFALSGTYGLTDRWDVNVLIPVFLTTLKLNGTSALLVPGAGTLPEHVRRERHQAGRRRSAAPYQISSRGSLRDSRWRPPSRCASRPGTSTTSRVWGT